MRNLLNSKRLGGEIDDRELGIGESGGSGNELQFNLHIDLLGRVKQIIRVFDNRIEFLNPGAPPKSIETFIREDISLPRNPILAKLFRSVRLAENAGTGFTKMIRGWQTYKGFSPVFHQEIDYTVVTFWLSSESMQAPNEGNATSGANDGEYDNVTGGEKSGKKDGVKGGTKQPGKGGVKISRIGGMKGGMKSGMKGGMKGGMKNGMEGSMKISLTNRQQEILILLIKDNSRTIDDIVEILKINRSAAQKHFDNLKSKGVIRRMGPDKGGFWEVLSTSSNSTRMKPS